MTSARDAELSFTFVIHAAMSQPEERAALYLQRHARGLVVRAARKRHATAAARSQKPHRTQRQSIAATMINNSMRNLLREKQHRAQIESAGSLVTDAGSQHERSVAALKQTKSTWSSVVVAAADLSSGWRLQSRQTLSARRAIIPNLTVQ